MQLLAPVLFITVQTLTVLSGASSKVNGKVIYNTGAIVLFVEILKLLVSLGAAYKNDSSLTELRGMSLYKFMLFSIPGLLYCVNNNIFLWIMTQISPSVFQVLLNLRIVVSALMFRCLLGRDLTRRQWLSTVTLTIGASLTQLSGLMATDQEYSMFGLLLTLFYTLLSTLAGVYSEVLLKKQDLSLSAANAALYAWGIVFNAIMLMMQSQQGEGGFFRGWEYPVTWMTLMFMAITGLLVSKIVRQFDTLIKIMCTSIGNILIYMYEVYFLAKPIDPFFIPAFILVVGSTYVYSTQGAAAPKPKMDTSHDESDDDIKAVLDGGRKGSGSDDLEAQDEAEESSLLRHAGGARERK